MEQIYIPTSYDLSTKEKDAIEIDIDEEQYLFERFLNDRDLTKCRIKYCLV